MVIELVTQWEYCDCSYKGSWSKFLLQIKLLQSRSVFTPRTSTLPLVLIQYLATL